MSKLEFVIELSASSDKLLNIASDFEKLPNFLPEQLKQVTIIAKTNNETTTEEILVFSTVVKNQIVQQTVHQQVDNILISTIVSGPAKGTIIEIKFEKMKSGTKVYVSVNLKLSLKAKFLQPIIKKWYKLVLTGILYKMNAVAEL